MVSINNFNLGQAQFRKLDQKKVEENTEQVVEQKVDAQKEKVVQPKMSSKVVLDFMENNAVNVQLTKKDSTIVVKKTTAEEAYGKKVTTEEVDGDGNKTITVEQYNKQGQLVSKEVSKYDANGNLYKVKKTKYNNDGSYVSTTEGYNKDGKIAYKFLEEYNNLGNCYNFKNEYYSYHEGYLTKIKTVIPGKTVIEGFNEQGKTIYLDIEESNEDGNGARILHKDYKYDEDGNLTSTYTFEYNTGDDTSKIISEEFDSLGRILKEEVTEKDNKGNITRTTVLYEYTFQGLTKTTTVLKNNNRTVTVEKQDRKGNIISKITYYYNPDDTLYNTEVEVEDKTNNNKIAPNAKDLSGSKIDLRNLKNNKIER